MPLVPFAGSNDLVFGGWDIYGDTAEDPLSAISPMKALFDHQCVKPIDVPFVNSEDLITHLGLEY